MARDPTCRILCTTDQTTGPTGFDEMPILISPYRLLAHRVCATIWPKSAAGRTGHSPADRSVANDPTRPLSRPFVCECHNISTVPRFQPPPRRTQRADFPHCALLFAARKDDAAQQCVAVRKT